MKFLVSASTSKANLKKRSQHSVFEKRDLFCCSHTFPNKYEFLRTPIAPELPVINKVVG